MFVNYSNNYSDTLTQVVNITLPCITVNSTSITCATLGSATVTAIGGVGPFNYTWMPSAQTSSVATGLSPGMYTITVHDLGNNYSYTATTLFTSLVPLTGAFASQLNLPCFGAATGTAQYTNIQGGSASQYFTWSNGNTSFSTTSAYVNTLTAGLWTATVVDALTGCTQQDLFLVIQPFAQVVSIAASSPTACVGVPISFTASTTGGTGSSYSYSWSPGPAGATHSVTQNTSGTYTYTVLSTDANTCTVPGTVSVQFIPLPTITVASASICPLETGTITASGASTYTWSGSSTGAALADSPTVTSSYSVIGTALACTAAATGSIFIKPLPTPVFNSNSPVCNGQALVLRGSGGTAYAWSGVGSYSSAGTSVTLTAVSPTNSGVYQLTVTAANSCTAATQQTLTVYPTPTVSAAGSTVCSNGTLLLSSNSVSNALYQWSGPGGFSSQQQNPSITAPSASITGNYTVTVFGTGNCSNTAVTHASVTPFITPTITSNDPLCQLNTLNLSVSGGASFQWNGPGGYFNSGTLISIPSMALSNAGVYSVTATNGPCTASQTHSVVVYPLPTPTAAYNAPVCETKKLILSATSTNTIITWAWFYPDGGAKSGQSISRDSSTTALSGTYTLQVTDSHQCSNSTTLAVTILQNPTVKATGATVCLNEPATLTASGAATYFWQGPDLIIANQSAAFIASATSSSPLVYTVTGAAANTCTHITTATLSTWPLPLPFITTSPANSLCLNSTVTLQAGGAVGYEWVGPNGFKEKGPVLPIVLNHVGYSGVYTLTGSDANGCKANATSTINVWPLPYGALITSKREACLPFCPVVTFTPFTTTSITAMQWNFAGTSFSTASFSKCLPDEGTYTVSGSIRDINGCSASASLSLTGYKKPVANFSMTPATPVESTDEVQLTAIGSEKLNYSWIINEQKPVRSQNTSFLFDQAGNYPITLIVSNAIGCADTTSKNIFVNQEFNVFIPNAFTPNYDNINDTFLPVTRGVLLYDLMIFDRYGHLLFRTNDPLIGWDGTVNGQTAKQDTYTYKLIITSNTQIQKQFLGEVLLYR
jgi:gliding motility-associated-like protein